MPLPEMDEQSRRRPISYDPARRKFILFDEIVSGREPIIPVDSLSDDELKELVIMRWRALDEDRPVQAMSGPRFLREDVIRAIEQDEPFGRMTLEAEKSYLRDLQAEIRRNLE